MKKILYIEDELYKNEKIIEFLLEDGLWDKIKTDLRKSIDNIDNSEIKKIINKNSEKLEVEYSFLSAFNKINSNPTNKYCMFVVDRHLDNPLDFRAEIEKIKDPILNSGYTDKYDDDAGDFLFLKLLLNTDFNLMDTFYFLTNNMDDEFSDEDLIQQVASLNKNFNFEEFEDNNKKDKLIETEELAKKVNNYYNNLICVKYKEYDICDKNSSLKQYVQILDRCGENAVDNFMEITENKDSYNKTTIKGNLVNLRQLLEDHIATNIINKVNNNSLYTPSWKPQLYSSNGINFGGFKSLLNEIIPVFEKGNILASKEEVSTLLKEIKPEYIFNKEGGNYSFTIGSLKSFILNNNQGIDNAKNIENLTFNYKNRFNEKLLVSEDIYDNIKYSWRKLSELIHSDESLTTNGENLIKNTDRAINTINILYYQLKEIILWFGQVMEKIESSDTPEEQ